MKIAPRVEVYYQPVGASEFTKPGWYWIAYSNPKKELRYEGGPFATRLEAELDLAEYLRK